MVRFHYRTVNALSAGALLRLHARDESHSRHQAPIGNVRTFGPALPRAVCLSVQQSPALCAYTWDSKLFRPVRPIVKVCLPLPRPPSAFDGEDAESVPMDAEIGKLLQSCSRALLNCVTHYYNEGAY